MLSQLLAADLRTCRRGQRRDTDIAARRRPGRRKRRWRCLVAGTPKFAWLGPPALGAQSARSPRPSDVIFLSSLSLPVRLTEANTSMRRVESFRYRGSARVPYSTGALWMALQVVPDALAPCRHRADPTRRARRVQHVRRANTICSTSRWHDVGRHEPAPGCGGSQTATGSSYPQGRHVRRLLGGALRRLRQPLEVVEPRIWRVKPGSSSRPAVGAARAGSNRSSTARPTACVGNRECTGGHTSSGWRGVATAGLFPTAKCVV